MGWFKDSIWNIRRVHTELMYALARAYGASPKDAVKVAHAAMTHFGTEPYRRHLGDEVAAWVRTSVMEGVA